MMHPHQNFLIEEAVNVTEETVPKIAVQEVTGGD
jgi:hypothetical protein